MKRHDMATIGQHKRRGALGKLLPGTGLLRLCLYGLISASLISDGLAQSVTAADKTAANQAGNNSLTLNLQAVDLSVLINMVAELTGKNFVIDPRVKAKVSVVSGGSLSSEQLYDVFLSILEVHNFAAVETGGIIKILPSNIIKQRPTPTVFSSKITPKTQINDGQITQIIQLRHANVQALVPIIRPLIPPTSHFAPHAASNSIVLTDTAANIQRVIEIVNSIDIPDKRASVRVVYLDKAKASDVAQAIQGAVTQITTNADGGVIKTGKVSIQPLNSINALVISAPDDEYAKIQALVDELDIERTLEGDVNVIYLKHANAVDLVSVLNDVTKPVEGSVADFSVQADEATNSLIVKASGAQLSTVRNVIDKLDVRRAQVFVETIIAEVSLDQAANLGVNWGLGDLQGENSSGNLIDLVDSDNPNQVIGKTTAGTNFTLANGGLNYSLLDFKKYKLDVIVNALRSDTNSNILSTPTILTLDNEEAEIVVGQEVPFITSRYDNGGGSSAQTTNSDGTSTVISNNQGYQNIERKDVGIKLRIKPQIGEGDTIKLEVHQEISSVSTTSIAGQADLITNRRAIEAVVQVDDGQVVVLGGLIQDDVIDTVDWVPILGKIPLIGALFRNNRKTAVKRNLMVFLKPRIVRSPSDLTQYSRLKYNDVRRDNKISEAQSTKYLIPETNPPILEKYENVINEGELGTEQQNNLRKQQELLDEAEQSKFETGLLENIEVPEPTHNPEDHE